MKSKEFVWKINMGIVGIAHVGLPTNDLQKTVEFYKSLGFEVIMLVL